MVSGAGDDHAVGFPDHFHELALLFVSLAIFRGKVREMRQKSTTK